MLTKLQSVDYVLVVLSKTYKARFEGHEEPGKGNGASHEGFLITQEIYENQSKNAKYIPIYFHNEDRKFAPDVLRAVTCYNVTRKAEYDRMYSLLTQQITPMPPLGERRILTQNQLDEHVFVDQNDFSGSGDYGSGGVAIETGSQLVELKINKNFDDFSATDQIAVLEAIGKLLKLDGTVRVVSKARGSVLLTVDLTPEQAERLYWLVEQGALAELDVTSARMVEGSGRLRNTEGISSRQTVAYMNDSIELVAEPSEERSQTATRIASMLFQKQPDWIQFFREVLGVDGLVRKLFTSPEELAAFEKTAQYAEIQAMVARLREKSVTAVEVKEPTCVIVVRLPKSLHESLRAEAHDRKTSMNQLCISKLLQVINDPE